jgi:hypothetical protein
MYDFTSAYLKPPLQIRVPHLHKAMSPNVTEDTVLLVTNYMYTREWHFEGEQFCNV